MVIPARTYVVFLLYHVFMCLCMCVQACLLEGEREVIIAHCFVSYFVGVHVAYACASQVSNIGTAR